MCFGERSPSGKVVQYYINDTRTFGGDRDVAKFLIHHMPDLVQAYLWYGHRQIKLEPIEMGGYQKGGASDVAAGKHYNGHFPVVDLDRVNGFNEHPIRADATEQVINHDPLITHASDPDVGT